MDTENCDGETPSKEKSRALIWNYFTKRNNTEAKCNYCATIIKTTSGTTSPMVRHLKKHPVQERDYIKLKETKRGLEVVKKRPVDREQLTITESLSKKVKFGKDDKIALAITKKIAFMMATDYQPFTIVEDIGFRSLLEELQPKYEIPCRTTFSRAIIPSLYKEEKEKLKMEINQVVNTLQSISFTTDMWTSRAKEGYISLTCHYLTPDFKMTSHVLGNSFFSGSHSGQAVYDKINSMLEEWNLHSLSIPVYVITDNASNLNCALEKSSWKHIKCFAHTLQLAISDAKNGLGIDTLLSKGRKVVGHYRHSTLARERLQNIQRQMEKPIHELLPMVPTRWNSEYIMLSRLVEQQGPISAELGTSLSIDCFTASEWKLASGLVKVLHPIDHATKELCSSSKPTLSMTIPIMSGIESILLSHVSNNEKNSGILFARALQKAIKSRFPALRTFKEALVAMVLDPRFKDLVLSDCEKSFATTLIVQELESVEKQGNGFREREISDNQKQVAQAQPTQDVWSYFEKINETQEQVNQEGFAEDIGFGQLKLYLQEPVIPRQEDPCHWWHTNKERFKLLVPVAIRYLGIPATQVASERQFSTAGNTVSLRRENLKPEHVEELVFLHNRYRMLSK